MKMLSSKVRSSCNSWYAMMERMEEEKEQESLR
jgi:hypothetical protein